MSEPSDRYRRQQRRRAIIAWLVGIPFLILFVVGIVAGASEEKRSPEHPGPFGYAMTAAQYAALRPGLEESAFVDRLGETGLPENLTKHRYTALFPPHGDEVVCSFWEISDRVYVVARVCFSSPQGRLAQKLERQVGSGEFGVNA